MTDDIAIRVNGLGKKYKISHETAGYKTLGETITNTIKRPVRRLRGEAPSMSKEDFWALKDVSFEVRKGEVVGIIGRNGAGKSTLLKILSRITTPTEGTVEVHGRVGSLLEVGTGFHPELSGRENIYLSGSILGMKRSEIDTKFDEIVRFAEMEKFLDTPVKRYSSGMYVRLAFAVAAHLEPEILIIDEVLAVGDTAFQKKCLGKMGDVAKEGRTVLFVSHNMSAVNELCSRGILLNHGGIEIDGEKTTVISSYLNGNFNENEGKVDLSSPLIRRNSLEDSIFKWKMVEIINSDGQQTCSIKLHEPFEISVTGELSKNIDELNVGFGVMAGIGIPIFNSHLIDSGLSRSFSKGEISFHIRIDPNYLAPGSYTLDFGANGDHIIDWIPNAITFNIEPISIAGDGIRTNFNGVVVYPCSWFID